MSWYQNATVAAILGALAGALLTAIASLFIWKKSRKISRIDCGVADPKSLLTVSDAIRDKLEVKYENKVVSKAYLFAIEIVNSGTESIENQPVLVRLAEGSTIIDYLLNHEPAIGFGDIYERKKDGHELDLEIALLNKQDRVSIEIFSIDNPSDTIEVGLKNKGVETRVYTRRSVDSLLAGLSGDRRLTGLAALSVLPFFGSIANTLITVELARRLDKVVTKPTKDRSA